MAETADIDAAPDTLEVTLDYLLHTGETPWVFSGGPGSTEVRYGISPEPHRVILTNGRPRAAEFALDRNGFQFRRHPSAVRDFLDAEELKRVYFPEVEAVVKTETGAKRVVVFDHTIRTADEDLRERLKIREVVHRVHNDYTEWSAPQRVRDFLPEEADALLRRPFAVVQMWRPFGHAVETTPLALCDASSVAFDDLVISERRYPGRVGQTYSVKYNPNHRWFWFPRMQTDEALVFKVYDSEKDGRARFTPHTAFEDPTTPASAKPRQSIEIRTFAFY